MLPLAFCGSKHRDWSWWQFWRKGHREHEYMGELEGPKGFFPQLMVCPGHEVKENG